MSPLQNPRVKTLPVLNLSGSIVQIDVTQAVLSVATTLESSRTGMKVVLFL